MKKLLIFFLVMHGGIIDSVPKRKSVTDNNSKRNKSSLDITKSLPPELLIHIIGFCADYTHLKTGGGLNSFYWGLEHSYHAVTQISWVNKQFNIIVHSNACIQELINVSSDHFETDLLTLATALPFAGAQKWVENYLIETGEYDLFKVVEKIRLIAQEVADKLIQKGSMFHIDMNKAHSTPDPYHNQTSQGLLLQVDSCPDTLCTPWGEVSLYRSCSGTCDGFLRLGLELFKKISVRLYHIYMSERVSINYPDFKMYEITEDFVHDKVCMKEIPRDELETYQGSQALIGNNSYGYNILYKILAINDKKLPQPILQEANKYRKYEVVRRIWHLMNRLYKQEMN